LHLAKRVGLAFSPDALKGGESYRLGQGSKEIFSGS